MDTSTITSAPARALEAPTLTEALRRTAATYGDTSPCARPTTPSR